MDTLQILCTLRNVNSFLDVYASDLLPRSITKTCTVILNADPHTKGGSLWLAVRFRPKSSYAYYFDSYVILPFVPDFVDFIQRNCTTWDHNRRKLQSLTSDVCGKYCCLFSIYMDLGYTTQQCVAFFGTPPDRHVEEMFTAEFRAKMLHGVCGQCCRSCLEKVSIFSILIIPNLTWLCVVERPLSITSSCVAGRMRRSSRKSAWQVPSLPRRSVSNRPTRWQITDQ